MKILNYREQPVAAKIVAIFDLEVDVKIPELDITIPWVNKNWKLLRTKTGGVFPVSPSFCEEQNGIKKWVNYDELDVRFQKEINKKVMELLEPFLRPEDIKS